MQRQLIHRDLLDNNNPNHIYYNLKLNNIYSDSSESIPFSVRDETSTLLDKQSNYKMTIQNFRLNLALPTFLMPIKEGFTSFAPVLTAIAITNANPCVITSSAPHGFAVNDAVRLLNGTGMTQINGDYFIESTPAPNTFTIKQTINDPAINSTGYGTYTPGSAEIQGINNNYNLTQWGICLSFSGNDYAEPVFFIPDKDIVANPEYIPKTPKQNDGLQDYSTFYYYVYSFNNIVKAINNALLGATNRLNADFPGSLPVQPYFIFDYQNNSKFSLVIPEEIISLGVEFYTNTMLLSVLQGFRTENTAFDNVLYKDFKWVLDNRFNSNAYSPPNIPMPAGPDYYIFTQEWEALYVFDQIVSILILSNHIRTRQEWYPKIPNPNSTRAIGRTSSDFNTGNFNILASFDLIDDGITLASRQILHYVPYVYKWVDLVSDDSLKKIDAVIYFETANGQLLQAEIPVNSSNNIRFLFERIR
jgi:hypothetical protein